MKKALLIVAHGSRAEETQQTFDKVVTYIRQKNQSRQERSAFLRRERQPHTGSFHRM